MPMYAEIPYRSFHPQRGLGAAYWYFKGLNTVDCYSIGLAPTGSLVGMGSYLNALSIIATSASYIVRSNIAVDVFLLTGALDFVDVEGFEDINVCGVSQLEIRVSLLHIALPWLRLLIRDAHVCGNSVPQLLHKEVWAQPTGISKV